MSQPCYYIEVRETFSSPWTKYTTTCFSSKWTALARLNRIKEQLSELMPLREYRIVEG